MDEHVQAAKSAPLFNPLSPDFIRDPYPHYDLLRTTDPMHQTPFGAFVASRHAEASFVLRDKRFGKDYVERTKRRYGPQIVEEPVFLSMSRWIDARSETATCQLVKGEVSAARGDEKGGRQVND